MTGDVSLNLLNHFSILETQSKHIDILSEKKTQKNSKILKDYCDIDVNILNLYSKKYHEEYKKLKSWRTIYEDLDVSRLKDYSSLYIMGGLYYPGSNLSIKLSRVGKFPADGGQTNYESVGGPCVNILAILKAHREFKIPLHEWTKTPEELCSRNFHKDFLPIPEISQVYHGYDIQAYNTKRLDSLQYFHNKNPVEYKDKPFDMTFGITAFKNTDREKYFGEIQKIFGPLNSNLFIKNKKTGENTFLSNEKYFDFIKKSKYTIVIPPYDLNCFSIFRFLESLMFDCIPLIHPDCNTEDLTKSFGMDVTFLKRLEPFNESERLDVLKTLKDCFMKYEQGFINVTK